MKISTIFRKAAELYGSEGDGRWNNSGCCKVIGRFEEPNNAPGEYDENQPAQLFFRGLYDRNAGFWWAHPGNYAYDYEARTARVLALLFAAEMAEAEGL